MGNENRSAYFSLESLKGTGCAADKIPQMALTKYTEAELASETETIRQSAKQVDGSYYAALGGGAACDEIGGSIQEKATKMAEDIGHNIQNTLQAL